MLAIHDLTVDVDGSCILNRLNIEVQKGEFVCLFGRNGAGKTTTFRTIMGYRKPKYGSLSFYNRNISGFAPWKIARSGIGFSPEESEVFADLTVEDNITFPIWTRPDTRRSAKERVAAAYDIFPKLKQYRLRGGAQLSGGERKMVSIARALVLDPELLLLDEPFEGLSPIIIPSIAAAIGSIRPRCSILLAESNIHHVPENIDRMYVIERGQIIFSGRLDEARSNIIVNKAITG